MKTFLMLHGINHNMFGKRDPKQYGTITLDEIDSQLKQVATEIGADEVLRKPLQSRDLAESLARVLRSAG